MNTRVAVKAVPRKLSDKKTKQICNEALKQGERIETVAQRHAVPVKDVYETLANTRAELEYERQQTDWSLIEAIKSDLRDLTEKSVELERSIQERLSKAAKNEKGDKDTLKAHVELTKLRLERLNILIKLGEKAKLNFDFLQPQVNKDVVEAVASVKEPPEDTLTKSQKKTAERVLKLVCEKTVNAKSV